MLNLYFQQNSCNFENYVTAVRDGFSKFAEKPSKREKKNKFGFPLSDQEFLATAKCIKQLDEQ